MEEDFSGVRGRGSSEIHSVSGKYQESKGRGVKTENRVIPLIKVAPKDLSVKKEGGIMESLYK